MLRSTALVLLVALTASSAGSDEPSKTNPVAGPIAATTSWEGKVMTVTGLIPAEQMGITLPHEHVLIRVLGPKTDLQDEGLATEELAMFGKAGGKTLVDTTSIGLDRQPLALKRISQKTGVQIVMGCGYYKDQWQNPAVRAMTEDDIFQEIVRDIVVGVDGVHAGVIGELGVDYPPKDQPLYPHEEKNLRAGARAQKATGAAINVHIECNSTPYEVNRIMNVIEEAGGDLSRVVASHRLPRPWEVHINVALAKRGCYIEFDTFGLEIWDSLRNQLNGKEDAPATIKALIAEGCLDKILISQDFACQLCYVKNGGYGYAHILKNVVPQLKAAGITDEQIRTILVENPKRLFAFKNYAKK
jgi:phosphotriesterase-related protein